MCTGEWSGRVALALSVVLCMVSSDGIPQAKPEEEPPALRTAANSVLFYEGILKREGYSVDATEQLKEATKSKNISVRWSALYLLAHRTREGAIPILKESLNDPHFRVRTTAARLLGALGDKSGIPILRKDLADLAPRNGAPDPNMKTLTGAELRRATGRRVEQVQGALEAAEALSELGDPNGLALSARMGLEGEFPTWRMDAIRVLTNLALLDNSVLKGQSTTPASVLIAMAESEPNAAVARSLMDGVARLPGPTARALLEKIAASPHLPEAERKAAQERLQWREEAERIRRVLPDKGGSQPGAQQ